MRFNFRKIASALASMAVVSSTVALAAAATFPAPFVQNGAGDVAIVWGNSLDLGAVTDISGSLSAAIASQGGSGSSGTPTGGDFVQLSKSSDNMNLGNTWSGVFGTTVDDEDLPIILADGTYSNGENEEYDYTQKITLGAPTLVHFADSDYNDREPTIGFQLAASTFALNYTLDFVTNPESDLVSGDLDDIESTTMHLFGKDYFVLDADNATSDLTLLDSAGSATVQEGETVTVSAGGKVYEVSISFIGSTEVTLVVNGQTTNSLAERETQKLPDGSYVGVREIQVQDYAGGIKQVEFSIGSGKLFLDNGAAVELNDEDVDGVKAYVVRGAQVSSKETIDKIVIEWITDDEVFLTPTQALSMPGFGGIKFTMNDFVTPYTEIVTVEKDGSDSMQLKVPIKSGLATFNILYANSTGDVVGIGKSSTERLATTYLNTIVFNRTNEDEWFVASYNSSTEASSYLLKIGSGDLDAQNDGNKTSIRDAVTGDVVCNQKSNGDTCDIGDVSLTITNTYINGNNKWVNITAGSGVSFNRIYTAQGMELFLPYTVPEVMTLMTNPGAINFVNGTYDGNNYDSWHLFMNSEDKDDTISAGLGFNATIDDTSDNKLQVSNIDSAQSEHEIGDTDAFETYVVSDLATKMVVYTNPDQDYAEITYWGSEAYGEVFLAAASVSTGAGEVGNFAVKDTELATSGMGSKNLIIVGGSCVNQAARSVLGLSATAPVCGADWQSATSVGAGSWLVQTFANPWSTGKVATLVAGYEQGDTVNAATALRTQANIDVTAGKKYTGTTATAATLVSG